jgi:formamidopyrimidine-DNA glycosylase
MPELPEVETTLRGISPYLIGETVTHVKVRQPSLRWPVPDNLAQMLTGQVIKLIRRRGKYLLFEVDQGTLMIHLGMSGSLRIAASDVPAMAHDHVDICLSSSRILRYRDPRRFGSILWVDDEPAHHPLLEKLGPEPLSDSFTGPYLYSLAARRKLAVKSYIMDSHVVVGVGNIYANEALFQSGIRPHRAAGRISLARYDRLVSCIKIILEDAIRQGGTTLRDFTGGDGQPGYFKHSLSVYGRAQQPCRNCGHALKEIRLGQRSTVFCSGCQS